MSEHVTLKDMRTAGWCRDGVKAWCAANGVDFRRLARGIPIEEVEAWEDAHVQRAVNIARKRNNGR